MYYGLILILEKFVLKKLLDKLPSFIQHLYTIFIFMMGWVIFCFDDVAEMGKFFVSLFTMENGLISNHALVTVVHYLPIILLGIVASTPIGATIYNKFKDKNYIWVFESIFCIVVLVIVISAMVSQSYSPFLYFRF